MIISHINSIFRPIVTSLCIALGSSVSAFASEIHLTLQKGVVADYGATPWYTPDIKMGDSQINFALDTGTALLWATTDKCNTPACVAHSRVNTKQKSFSWVPNPDYPKTVSFGPWGSMTVGLGRVPLALNGVSFMPKIQFNGSIDYTGSKFQYLAWGGGIGFPSETSAVDPDINSIMRLYYNNGLITYPMFSIYTDTDTGQGGFILGGYDESLFQIATQVILRAKKSSTQGLNYLWGTNLKRVTLGATSIPSLESGMFYLDSGSSRFKGGRDYIQPILDQLLTYVDSQGVPIFEKIVEGPSGTPYVGVKYANNKSPQDFPDVLPDLNLRVGESCAGNPQEEASISLSAQQYSYQVDVGDRAGEWVAAFHVLDGVDGLLVGSTFMDLVYTIFQHTPVGQELVQSQMNIYKKTSGDSPVVFECVPKLKIVDFRNNRVKK